MEQDFVNGAYAGVKTERPKNEPFSATTSECDRNNPAIQHENCHNWKMYGRNFMYTTPRSLETLNRR